jgi:hypothetical protein
MDTIIEKRINYESNLCFVSIIFFLYNKQNCLVYVINFCNQNYLNYYIIDSNMRLLLYQNYIPNWNYQSDNANPLLEVFWESNYKTYKVLKHKMVHLNSIFVTLHIISQCSWWCYFIWITSISHVIDQKIIFIKSRHPRRSLT